MYRYSITRATREDLDALDALRDDPACSDGAPVRFVGHLRREVEAAGVAGSVSIENMPASAADVVRVLAGDPPPELCSEECAAIDAYRDAHAWTLAHVREPMFAYREAFVLAVQRRLMQCEPAAAVYRTSQVYLGDTSSGGFFYEPPPWHLLPGLVRELCDWANEAEAHPAVRAALLHVRLAGIHPFPDGNGRLARIFAAAAMAHGGFTGLEFMSLEQWWGAHRGDYYRAFLTLGTSWDPDTDVTKFVATHVRAQRLQGQSLRRSALVECAVFEALEELLAEMPDIPSRSIEAVHEVVFGRALTVPLYGALAGIPTVEARRDLATLEGARLLESCEAGGERRFSVTRELVGVLGSHLDIDMGETRGVPASRLSRVLVASVAERLNA